MFRLPVRLITAFFILLILIVIACCAYFLKEAGEIKESKVEELSIIADLKVNQIRSWRDERIIDAESIFHNCPSIDGVDAFFKNIQTEKAGRDISEWLDSILRSEHYKNAMLIDPDGNIRLTAGPAEKKLWQYDRRLLKKAVTLKEIVFSDLYKGDDGDIYIDIIVPLVADKTGSARFVGTALLRIAARQFLYPLIQAWPTASRTAETLLVRQEGNSALFLNELRHRTDTALSLKIPLAMTQVPAVMAILKKDGVYEGRDYRGVPVLAVTRKIPGSPWHMVAKIDENEIYEAIKKEAWYVGILGFLAVSILVMIGGLIWTRRLSSFYKRQYEEERLRAKIEKDLADANALCTALIDTIPFGMDIVDQEGTILFINDQLRSLFGDGAVGQKCWDLYKDNKEKCPNCPLREPVAPGKTSSLEVEGCLNGKILQITHTGMVYKDRPAVLEIFQNITERKHIDKMKDEFVSVVSHELRTPLSITKEGISLVLDQIPGRINEKQHSILTTARNNINRLARIINSLLDISKIEAGKFEIRKEVVDINSLIMKVAASFDFITKKNGVEMRIEAGKEPVNINADHDALTMLITNLLANAVKFTKEGHVGISLIDKKDEIECSISDTGRGISKEDLPKLFNKFEQFGRAAGPGEKGTGLGLSIAKGIVKLHRGKIWVESELGKGTKVTFTLPK